MQQEILAHSSTGLSFTAFGMSFVLTDTLQIIALIVTIVAGIAAYRLSTARRKYLENKRKD